MEGPLKLPKLSKPQAKDEGAPRVDVTRKVLRYRAGQVPEYVKKVLEEDEDEDDGEKSESVSDDEEAGGDAEDENNDDIFGLTGSSALPQTGLRRRNVASGTADPPEEDQKKEFEVKFEPESENEEMEESDGDEDESERRARRHRQRRLMDLDASLKNEDILGGEEEDADEQFEVPSSSSDEEDDRILSKPVFRDRQQRLALEEARQEEDEAIEREQNLADEKAARRLQESKDLLAKTVEEMKAKEEKAAARVAMGLDAESEGESEQLPNDEITDEQAEYAAWQDREIARLHRDALAHAARVEEVRGFPGAHCDFVRHYFRNPTWFLWIRSLSMYTCTHMDSVWQDQQRIKPQADKELEGRGSTGMNKADMERRKQNQVKMNFMQKYYHKGAFYQNVVESGAEVVFDRNFNEAVGEDALDKSLLPKAMHVRRGEFGKKGRSKHTHLADVDTTDRFSLWEQGNKLRQGGKTRNTEPKNREKRKLDR